MPEGQAVAAARLKRSRRRYRRYEAASMAAVSAEVGASPRPFEYDVAEKGRVSHRRQQATLSRLHFLRR